MSFAQCLPGLGRWDALRLQGRFEGEFLTTDARISSAVMAARPVAPAGSFDLSPKRQVVLKCDSVTKPGFDQCLRAIWAVTDAERVTL